MEIPINSLELGVFTPRLSIDYKYVKKLSDDIAQNGLQKTVLVRPHPETPNKWQLIDGNHRTEACRLAGLDTIRAEIRKLSDEEAVFLALHTNLWTGKGLTRYFLPSLAERKCPALDMAVEVVYFPTFDNKPRYGKMDRRFKSTIQDYEKLVELMKITTPTPFCKEAAMMFFSNTRYKDQLNKKFRSFPFKANVGLFRYISQCI